MQGVITLVVELFTATAVRIINPHINYTWRNNIIPRMAAEGCWGVETSKLVYPSTFGHVPTCAYMSYRPNNNFVPKQQKDQYVSAVYC
jgi:hypothetical protein